MARFARVLNENLSVAAGPRDRAEVSRFFRRPDLVGPGVVQVSAWRPRNEAAGTAAAVRGGVARKPERVRIPFARDPAFELNTR